jgi:hypothetical protein
MSRSWGRGKAHLHEEERRSVVSRQHATPRGLAELGEWFDAQEDEPETEAPAAEGPPEPPESTTIAEAGSAAATCIADAIGADVATILSELASADDTLARIRSQDEAARALAGDLLERYDALAAPTAETTRALARARAVREQAEALAAGAFAEEARVAARRVADRAAAAEARAEGDLAARRAEAARFAAEHDLEPLLEERRRRRAEEAETARAARAAKAERLAGALAAAEKALAASQLKEARELLGHAANENPGSPEIASLLGIIAQRELEGKVQTAEEALSLARYEWQEEPRRAVERLAALDVEGLPLWLARGLFGCWTEACSRLCRQERYRDPLRYGPPGPCRGVVVARREPGGPYQVVSALGLPGFPPPGSPVPSIVFDWARPLW